MAIGSKGRLYSFIDSKGQKQKAVAYESEQASEFTKVKKVFIRYVGDDFLPMKDNEGKNIVGLKDNEHLTLIGYVD